MGARSLCVFNFLRSANIPSNRGMKGDFKIQKQIEHNRQLMAKKKCAIPPKNATECVSDRNFSTLDTLVGYKNS